MTLQTFVKISPNFYRVKAGGIEIWYSEALAIAFRRDDRVGTPTVRTPEGQTITCRDHIRRIMTNNSRLPDDLFNEALAAVESRLATGLMAPTPIAAEPPQHLQNEPTDGPLLNYIKLGGDFLRVTIGDVQVWFSFSRPIGFQVGNGTPVVREGGVASSARRHRNMIDGEAGGSDRPDGDSRRWTDDEFNRQLNALRAAHPTQPADIPADLLTACGHLTAQLEDRSEKYLSCSFCQSRWDSGMDVVNHEENCVLLAAAIAVEDAQ